MTFFFFSERKTYLEHVTTFPQKKGFSTVCIFQTIYLKTKTTI